MSVDRVLSVCSGIEAASVAWSPLGWRTVAVSETDKAASAVLAHHYPDVPNYGDMTKWEFALSINAFIRLLSDNSMAALLQKPLTAVVY